MAESANAPIIVDASVAIKLFVEEEGSDRAQELLAEIASNPESCVVPELFFFELANTLNRLIDDSGDERLDLFNSLIELGIGRAVFTTDLAAEIRKYQALGLSGYDSAYVAVASSVQGIWVTADERAHSKIVHLSLSRLL